MKYQSQIMKQNKKQIQKDLLKLYVSSGSWEEFKVNADLKLPDHSGIDMTACRLYWLSKSHPIVHRLIIMFPIVIAMLLCTLSSMLSKLDAVLAELVLSTVLDVFFGWLLAALSYSCLYRETIARIECLEEEQRRNEAVLMGYQRFLKNVTYGMNLTAKGNQA